MFTNDDLRALQDLPSIRDQRATSISEALETPEGRMALAQSMVEPIRRQLEYQAIGRRLFMVDELPQGAYSRYERGVRSQAHRITVPTFEIAVNPTISLSEVTSRRFYIIERAQQDLRYEEECLNAYLIMMEQLKIECMREKIPHYSIMWLEVD